MIFTMVAFLLSLTLMPHNHQVSIFSVNITDHVFYIPVVPGSSKPIITLLSMNELYCYFAALFKLVFLHIHIWQLL